MRWLAKPLLGLMTAVIPVFIAACYGAPGYGEPWDDTDGYDPEKSVFGRVLSALTGSGIPYIRVSCLVDGASTDSVYDEAYSVPNDGAFELWASEWRPCDTLLFEDLDGAENGAFQSLEIPFVDDGAEIVVDLEPAE
jgi:hypothetical protein